MDHWVVHKFGGTSVGNADCMRKCAEIIKPYVASSKVAVVVSAMGGKPKVTDMLLDSVHAAAKGDRNASENLLREILKKHEACVSDILKDLPVGKQILAKITLDLADINDLLRAVSLMRTAHEQILELVSGYGEVLLFY
jgi:aspartokinase